MYKLTHLHYDLCKHFLNNRIAAIWNSLPNTIVSAESIHTFKSRLDKFWAHRDSKFVWNADITGIGSRSINSYSYNTVTVYTFFRYGRRGLGPGSVNSHWLDIILSWIRRNVIIGNYWKWWVLNIHTKEVQWASGAMGDGDWKCCLQTARPNRKAISCVADW